MEQRLSLVTLGVADLDRARGFYEQLGWRGQEVDETVFFQAGTIGVVLWDRDRLAEDSGVDDVGAAGFAGVALAHNVRSPAEVDAIFATAADAGATITRAPGATFYGGYAGCFADPDGHIWEIAHNPGFPLSDDGALTIPDFNAGRPVESVGRISISDYDPAWVSRFAGLGADLRAALGDGAVRIDHIGSTAVPGLAAKPVIDIQVSVRSLEPVEPFADPLTALGYVFRSQNPERTKRYFREPPGRPRTHVHVRRAGSLSEQLPLLFREFLRAHPGHAEQFARRKSELAAQHPHDRLAYTDAKAAFVWQILRQADAWAQQIGWEPPASDA